MRFVLVDCFRSLQAFISLYQVGMILICDYAFLLFSLSLDFRGEDSAGDHVRVSVPVPEDSNRAEAVQDSC